MQLTPEALAAIERADELLHVAADPLASTWLDGLHENARSLTPLYDSGGERIEIYSRMADEIVAPARAGRRVCAAFYGNPGVEHQDRDRVRLPLRSVAPGLRESRRGCSRRYPRRTA